MNGRDSDTHGRDSNLGAGHDTAPLPGSGARQRITAARRGGARRGVFGGAKCRAARGWCRGCLNRPARMRRSCLRGGAYSGARVSEGVAVRGEAHVPVPRVTRYPAVRGNAPRARQVGQRYGVRFPRDFGLLVKQALYFDR